MIVFFSLYFLKKAGIAQINFGPELADDKNCQKH